MVRISAPANIKLAGEHGVVHGTDCIAAAVDKLAATNAEKGSDDRVTITLKDLKESRSFRLDELSSLYRSWKEKRDIKAFIDENNKITPTMLPFAFVASRLELEFTVPVIGTTLTSSSEVPKQKGYASSTSIGASFVGASIKLAGVHLKDEDIIDVMKDVDRIIHINPNAGRIDIGPAYYGGYVCWSPTSGYSVEHVPQSLNFLVVDVGKKPSTSQMVGIVNAEVETYPGKTEKLFSEMKQIVLKEKEALHSGDPARLGELMSQNQKILKELWVSSEGLDKMARLAEENGAYGAKLSGGGGGGMGIVLCDPACNDLLIDVMRGAGFEVERIQITERGVKEQLDERTKSIA
jgi:mevalonate kinase